MVSVVGAGPAGLFAAERLSGAGIRVTVFEEHPKIGLPVQCTGIVTEALNRIVRLKEELIVNRINTALISAGRESIQLPVKDVVLDRAAFDQYLGERAESAGAKLCLGKHLSTLPKGPVIGADGPKSRISQLLNPGRARRCLIGQQARVRGSFDTTFFEVRLGQPFQDFFYWTVPESESIARVGCAGWGNQSGQLNRAISSQGYRIIDRQAGLIPLYDPRLVTQEKERYIVGDAATQVKASTGGGLVPGLECAGILADCIANGRDYHREWRRRIGPGLMMHLRVRQIISRCSQSELERLVRTLRGTDCLFADADRDRMTALAFSLALKRPRLLWYLRKL